MVGDGTKGAPSDNISAIAMCGELFGSEQPINDAKNMAKMMK